jgi:hypothetical protein
MRKYPQEQASRGFIVKVRVRKQYGAQVWRRRIDAWQQSGLSQKAFCGQNHLALSTFTLWRQRLNKPAKLPSRPASACIEIVPVPRVHAAVVVPPSPVIVVVVGGRYRIELADGFHRDTLQQVLQVLEARP